MAPLTTISMALAVLALAGGTALAQSTASDPAADPGKAAGALGAAAPGKMEGSTGMSAAPNTGAMKLSPADAQTMRSCRAMAPDAMMADAGCKAFMKRHPQAMNSGSPTPKPTPAPK